MAGGKNNAVTNHPGLRMGSSSMAGRMGSRVGAVAVDPMGDRHRIIGHRLSGHKMRLRLPNP